MLKSLTVEDVIKRNVATKLGKPEIAGETMSEEEWRQRVEHLWPLEKLHKGETWASCYARLKTSESKWFQGKWKTVLYQFRTTKVMSVVPVGVFEKYAIIMGYEPTDKITDLEKDISETTKKLRNNDKLQRYYIRTYRFALETEKEMTKLEAGVSDERLFKDLKKHFEIQDAVEVELFENEDGSMKKPAVQDMKRGIQETMDAIQETIGKLHQEFDSTGETNEETWDLLYKQRVRINAIVCWLQSYHPDSIQSALEENDGKRTRHETKEFESVISIPIVMKKTKTCTVEKTTCTLEVSKQKHGELEEFIGTTYAIPDVFKPRNYLGTLRKEVAIMCSKEDRAAIKDQTQKLRKIHCGSVHVADLNHLVKSYANKNNISEDGGISSVQVWKETALKVKSPYAIWVYDDTMYSLSHGMLLGHKLPTCNRVTYQINLRNVDELLKHADRMRVTNPWIIIGYSRSNASNQNESDLSRPNVCGLIVIPRDRNIACGFDDPELTLINTGDISTFELCENDLCIGENAYCSKDDCVIVCTNNNTVHIVDVRKKQ